MDRDEMLKQYFKSEDWNKAITLLHEWLKEDPDNHWLLTRLGSAYYEQRDYKKALKYEKQALKLSPQCPLVLWDYAGSLCMLDRDKEAIKIYKKLLRWGGNPIKYDKFDKHDRDIRWARSLVNDCRHQLGVCYTWLGNYNLAKKYLKEYIIHRNSCRRSIYNLREVRKELAKVEAGENPWDI